jgi:hypothetical protein
MQYHATEASGGRLSLSPPLCQTPDLARGLIVWRVVLFGAEGSTAAPTSIDGIGCSNIEHATMCARWRYLVPPCLAGGEGAVPLILRGVINMAAAPTMPHGWKGGS